MKFNRISLPKLLVLFFLFFYGPELRADNPPNLDDWLNNHPQIAEAINWEFPVAPASPSSTPEAETGGSSEEDSGKITLWKKFIILFPKPKPKLPVVRLSDAVNVSVA